MIRLSAVDSVASRCWAKATSLVKTVAPSRTAITPTAAAHGSTSRGCPTIRPPTTSSPPSQLARANDRNTKNPARTRTAAIRRRPRAPAQRRQAKKTIAPNTIATLNELGLPRVPTVRTPTRSSHWCGSTPGATQDRVPTTACTRTVTSAAGTAQPSSAVVGWVTRISR